VLAEDTVVGYARIRLIDGDAKVLQVCVDRNHQRRGLATAMMAELMRVAREAGRADVYLDAREHVIPYYLRLGFVEEGEFFDSPRTGTPHRVMRYVFE
jgi:ribosomal protein S18 acetylase RimI-like enzyme